CCSPASAPESEMKGHVLVSRDALILHLLASKIFKQWHWFHYHFAFYLKGQRHPFAEAIIDACLACERAIPGFAAKMIDELASIGGAEKYLPHYDQLLQRLAELLVIRQLVTF